MIQNRRFALAFRIIALLFAIAGVTAQIGIFGGNFYTEAFMYYTIQTNLLAIVLFAMLAVKTAKSLREGTCGSAGWFTRFEMVCVVNIMLTFSVFWLLISNRISSEYLASFENISTHLLIPLLCLADYVMFSEAHRLRYRDVYLTCVFPIIYFIFIHIISILGYTFDRGLINEHIISADVPSSVRFPYFFLDYERVGFMAIAYIMGILAFILLLGHGMYVIDRKRAFQ